MDILFFIFDHLLAMSSFNNEVLSDLIANWYHPIICRNFPFTAMGLIWILFYSSWWNEDKGGMYCEKIIILITKSILYYLSTDCKVFFIENISVLKYWRDKICTTLTENCRKDLISPSCTYGILQHLSAQTITNESRPFHIFVFEPK